MTHENKIIEAVSSRGLPKKYRALFLGYNRFNTCLIDFLESKDYAVTFYEDRLNGIAVENFDIIISFGYRYIIKPDVLARVKRDIINLHIAYLPFNRGAHPNFWSFHDDTVKGVSIHLIDEGVDTGPLVARRQVEFTNKEDSFDKSYNFLVREIEELFIEKWPEIEAGTFTVFKAEGEGSFHYRRELPDLPFDWNDNIEKTLQYLNKANKE